jgi:hypothetical protein
MNHNRGKRSVPENRTHLLQKNPSVIYEMVLASCETIGVIAAICMKLCLPVRIEPGPPAHFLLAVSIAMRLINAQMMSAERKFSGSGGILRSGLIAVLVSLILLIPVLSASPVLHSLIHSDASSPDHHCAITLFAKGHVSSTLLPPIAASFVPRLTETYPLEPSVACSVFDVQLAPSRGPPVS